ncbi:hypothetical protein DFH94DRAFT_797758 [Russula ochroleuca]|uniref:Uncharacterized protein n=1 Tax=Russula ochroleuca TaxID=152965 RepID=A0A9P5N6E9_9AGAM|nr:hypothetical protein DFH94DRAFT_797758 [Russula ochroleuca]
MSTEPSTYTSISNFMSIFNAALEYYKRKTKNDLVSHPLLPTLQSCDSPKATRDRIPAFDQSQIPRMVTTVSQNGSPWSPRTPTVNVLYAFSDTLGQGVVLSLRGSAFSSCQLIDLFNRIERFFGRLEIYTGTTPTTAMRDIIVEIMVEVRTMLAIATKEVKHGQLKKYLKKLTSSTDIKDSLERLDKLTQEEARMASAELLKMTHGVDGKVMGADDRVKGVDDRLNGVDVKVHDVRSDVHDVGNKVQGVEGKVLGVDNKIDQVNRS